MSAAINLADIQRQRDKLEERLELGYKKIADSQVDGEDNEVWVDHFIDLLKEYEALADALMAEA